MLSIITLIILSIAVLALFFVYIRQRKVLNTYSESQSEDITDDSVGKKLDQALKSLLLTPKIEKNDEKYLLHVDYQNAHFIFNFKNAKQQGIDIIFPFFYKEKADYADAIRAFCNRINSYHSPIVASYITNSDYLFINASTNISSLLSVKQIAEEFVLRASTFFSYQREMTSDLIEEIKKVKKYEIFDLEYNDCCDSKMQQLLSESTINTQTEALSLPENFLENKNTLTIEQLISGLHFFDPAKITKMEIITGHSIICCNMPEKIRSYKVCTPLLGSEHPDENISRFRYDESVIKLYYSEQFNPEVPQSVTEQTLYLMLQSDKTTSQVLYYKATLCHPKNLLANTPLPSLHESLHGHDSITLLLGYEITTANQQKAEFDFMYKDIDDKIAENKTNDLTPEQLIIFGITNPDAAFFAYWGKRFVRQGRYLEASIRFMQAWKYLNKDFETLKKNEKKAFYEISALIGLCLYKLNMPKTALYYYHLASEIENTYYFCMLIKCMIAAGDPSCLKHIENSLNETVNQITELQEDEEEIPDTLTRLYHFLRRSKVQICVQRNLLDDAEKLCQEMAKENTNSDFALTYLKLIHQRREEL